MIAVLDHANWHAFWVCMALAALIVLAGRAADRFECWLLDREPRRAHGRSRQPQRRA